MDSSNFCYWLHGFTEISGLIPTDEQWVIIMDHLKLTLKEKEKPETLFCGSSVPYFYPSGTLPLTNCADCGHIESGAIMGCGFWLCHTCEQKNPKAVKCKTDECINKSTTSSGYCTSCNPTLC